jgi:hypothetical protein
MWERQTSWYLQAKQMSCRVKKIAGAVDGLIADSFVVRRRPPNVGEPETTDFCRW